jgi:4-hydroxy-2,2'-bipyrrole-5-carbaldehyde O-methyltransferase
MLLRIVRGYLRGGHVVGRSLVMTDLYRVMRAQFLHAALESGLLHALREPKTRDELIEQLRVENEGLLDGLLEHGVVWRELRHADGRYSLRGRRSRALVGNNGDAYAALVQETIAYHGSVYTELAERLRGAPVGDYLEQTGELVARSSRVGEPVSAAFLHHLVRRVRPRTVLDVGCGSAVHLRYAVRRRRVTGVGVEVSPEAAEHARRNVKEWGLGDRVRIVCGDVRDPLDELASRFDLVLLFHNLYYFEPQDRPALFERIHELTSERGALTIVCLFHGGGRLATDLDVVLRSTRGHTPLPDLDETVNALEASGFTVDRPKRFIPVEPLYGLVARPR